MNLRSVQSLCNISNIVLVLNMKSWFSEIPIQLYRIPIQKNTGAARELDEARGYQPGRERQ